MPQREYAEQSMLLAFPSEFSAPRATGPCAPIGGLRIARCTPPSSPLPGAGPPNGAAKSPLAADGSSGSHEIRGPHSKDDGKAPILPAMQGQLRVMGAINR